MKTIRQPCWISGATIVAALFVAGLTSFRANGADWPEHLTLHEHSRSPDGHYGIVVSTSSHVDDATTFLIAQDGEQFCDYFADLQTHRLLGKIKNFEYVERENHAHLDVEWTADSKLCIATYWGRYGMRTIAALEPKQSGFAQADLGERIQKSLDAALRKQNHGSDLTADVYPHCHPVAARKIRARALGRNNPKSLEEVKTCYALFEGEFDLATKKWTAADARSLDREQGETLEDTLGTVYADFGDEGFTISQEAFKDETPETDRLDRDDVIVFRSEEAKAKYLDEEMNRVYKAARLLLPPPRFAIVKQAQIAWLKERDATNSTAGKCKLMEERIKALQELLR
jgi:uncharacterized protein YecT (DUF1311 family)